MTTGHKNSFLNMQTKDVNLTILHNIVSPCINQTSAISQNSFFIHHC